MDIVRQTNKVVGLVKFGVVGERKIQGVQDWRHVDKQNHDDDGQQVEENSAAFYLQHRASSLPLREMRQTTMMTQGRSRRLRPCVCPEHITATKRCFSPPFLPLSARWLRRLQVAPCHSRWPSARWQPASRGRTCTAYSAAAPHREPDWQSRKWQGCFALTGLPARPCSPVFRHQP